jgi:thioredoxin 2
LLASTYFASLFLAKDPKPIKLQIKIKDRIIYPTIMKLLPIIVSLQGVLSFQSIRAVNNHVRSSAFLQSTSSVDYPVLRNATFALNRLFRREKGDIYQKQYRNQPNIIINTKIRKTGLDSHLILKELREKSIKDLKLQCSRRSIRYVGFENKEDFVQGIFNDMKELESFSISGSIFPGKVAELSADILEEELESDIPILLDIYGNRCGPCKLLEPEYEAAARKLGKTCRVAKLDSEKYDEVASKYNVEGLPTTLLIHKGEVLNRLEGTVSRQQILDFVKPCVEKE